MAVWQVWAGGLAAVLVLMTLTWAVAVLRHDVSLVDRVWGLSFVVLAVVYAAIGDGAAPRTALVLLLVVTWGSRLSWHITRRNWGSGEDARYAEMRRRRPESFPVTSLYRVFWLQAGLAWLISLPLAAALHRSEPATLRWLDLLGLLVWLVGFGFEAIGDRQLRRFLADPANRGAVLDRGLWRYTRHPNYFGDATLWWGYFLFALATGAWWTVIGPAVMTVLIVRVSGVALTDRRMASDGRTRRGYDEYVRRTNAFIPGPRRD